jgi:hypothetical protein
MMGMGEEASSCGSISIRHFRFEGFLCVLGSGGGTGVGSGIGWDDTDDNL